jgi:hypothetical protein
MLIKMPRFWSGARNSQEVNCEPGIPDFWLAEAERGVERG